MNTRTDDWEAVWAEYDSRAGSPRFQAHTPWYMDPDYAGGQEPSVAESGGRGRPFVMLATMAMVVLAFMLNIRLVPEAPAQVAAWQPLHGAPAAPVAMLSLGAPAEAASTMPARASATSSFGDLLQLPPPDWVQASAAPAPAAPERAATAAVSARQRLAARDTHSRHAQARPPGRLVAAHDLPDQLCAPAPARQQQAAARPHHRQAVAAAGSRPAGAAAVAATQARVGKAQVTTHAPAPRQSAALAMAGAPRAPPGAHARS